MLRDKVEEIKYSMSIGLLTYKEAKIELQPFLDEANKKGFEIAKKYNKKFNKLTFAYVIR